jgi:ABC-2 type transport system permease protein
MANESIPPTSFSVRHRWVILCSVLLSTVAVVALVGMANYLSSRYLYPLRFTWSDQAQKPLSPQTVGLLRTLTNQVKVVIYFDKKAELYGVVSPLLEEFRLINPKISIESVDYEKDAGAAQKIKDTYKLGSSEAKDLVIFDCNGRIKIVSGKALGDYALEPVAGDNDKERNFRRSLKSFKGESAFSVALLSVTTGRPLKAYFLQGHGEHNPDGQDEFGYLKFNSILQQNFIQTEPLQLLGTNTVPLDCNLLIIAGARRTMLDIELGKIKQYLDQGGRLMVLFNNGTEKIVRTGLEPILADWGVEVGKNRIKDLNSAASGSGFDLVITDFNKNHPLVSPLLRESLQLILPCSISRIDTGKAVANAPKVEELAFTSDKAIINDSPVAAGNPIPLMVAVEKAGVKGVSTERGLTRILVVGDSNFLDNLVIDAVDNSSFAGYAINWLLDQTQLLQGVAPRTIKEYKFLLTRSQMQSVGWLFLAGMPGGILILGGLVWLRRRH